MVTAREGPAARSSLWRLVGLTGGVWFAFGIKQAVVGGRPRTVLLNFCVVGVIAALAALVRLRFRLWRILVHGTIAASAFALMLTSWWSGGARANAWWYLVALVLVASRFLGARATLFWTGASVIATTLSILDPWALPDEFHPDTADTLIAGASLLVMVSAFGWLAQRAVEERMKALRDASRAKGELLATISHEVRTPLHGILGIASVLSETRLSPNQRELVDALRTSSKSLKRIVDDVLDLSRAEAAKVSLEIDAVDLMETLEDVVDLHAFSAALKKLSLTLTVTGATHLRARADGVRVGQIVSNLISNAIKFTTEGGVEVRVVAAPGRGRTRIQVRVTDTGPGIPGDRLDRLFTTYDRIGSEAARLHEGSGLGLAIARDLATQMGGTLEVERDRARGASFVLDLDLEAVTQPTPTEDAPLVLMVEADEDARRAALSVSAALAGEVDLVVVATIEDAMNRIAAQPPCAIVVSVDATRADPATLRATLERACAEYHERLVYALPPQSPDASAEWLEDWSPSIVKPIRRSRIRALVARDRPMIAQRESVVLIVDDEAVNRAVLRGLVEHRGLRAVEASSGELGLRELASGHFDVVLSDLHMPDMDGVRFIELARARGFRGWAIAQTASVLERDRDRCLAAGFNAFLRKPFQPSELDSALDRRTDLASDAAPQAVRLVEDARWLEIASLMADAHHELVRSYFASARRHLDTLREQVHDGPAVRAAAHALAGSSLMIGLVGVGAAARAFESVAESLGVDDREARIGELAALLEATRDHPMLRALPRSAVTEPA